MDLFAGINDIDEATAKRRFGRLELASGQVLTREGEPSRGLAWVRSGELVVHVNGSELGRVRDGGLLGEMGLFADGRRTATVRATEDTELLLLTREGYEELRDTLHPVCVKIEQHTLRTQVARIRRAGHTVSELGLGVPSKVRPATGFFAAVARLFGSGEAKRVDRPALNGLLASPLFEEAPRPCVEQIAERFEAISCPGGVFLCTEGEIGEAMYVLETGQVNVLVDGEGEPQHIATLEPGAAFGMVSLLGEGGPRMASCVVEDQAILHRLDHDAWNALISNPYMVGSTFRRAVIRALAAQLDYSNAQIATFREVSATESLQRAREALAKM